VSERKNKQSEEVGEIVSIFLRGRTWYISYPYERRTIRYSLKTRSKKEARRRAMAKEREILDGETEIPKQSPLLDDVIESYMSHLVAENRSKKTIDKYRFCLQRLQNLATRRKVRRVSGVDLELVDVFKRERIEQGAAPKTLHNDVCTIKQLVNFAERREMIPKNPLRNLKMKMPKRTPQPCWRHDEVERIIGAAKPPYQAIYRLLADTGMRIGEAVWLTWNDIDLDAGLIYIRPKPGWKPKSGDQRSVPMSSAVEQLLRTQSRVGDWVFTARPAPDKRKKGQQIYDRRALEHLKRILKGLGLQGHLHTFRHSFVSYAAIRGVPERILRKWIGHVDQQILDWYFHLADEQSKDAMNQLFDAPSDHATGTDDVKFDNPTQPKEDQGNDSDLQDDDKQD